VTSWLQCNVCGEELFESDAEGLFWEDTEAVCSSCGTISWVGVDNETAYVSSNEEVEDKGQNKCDGSCGAVAEFVGAPCRWDCERTAKANPSDQNLSSMLEINKQVFHDLKIEIIRAMKDKK